MRFFQRLVFTPFLLFAATLVAQATPAAKTSPADKSAPALQASSASMPAPQLVFLDTDIGDDIDDAFALGLILKSPELKLLGITTAFGDTVLRARLVEQFLSETNSAENIPVHAGLMTKTSNIFTQSEYARAWKGAAPPTDGVDFLLRTLRAHPHQVTLIAIGPLFNIEAAIQKDPEGFRLVQRVIIMAGSIYRGYDSTGSDSSANSARPPDAEWNVKCNPSGLRALLASGVPVLIAPLVSTQIKLPADQAKQLFAHGSPLTDQLALLTLQWKSNSEWHPIAPTLYDPVAVSMALIPALCPTTPLRITVDEQGFTRRAPNLQAATPNTPAANIPASSAEVCLHSDKQAFLSFLLARLASDNASKHPQPAPAK